MQEVYFNSQYLTNRIFDFNNSALMAKNLVIVESPAKIKTISKFLGKDYLILASYGHVRDLPKGRLGIDLKNEYEPEYVNSKEKIKVIKELKQAGDKVEFVYIATDPDREGEAIAWHIQNAMKLPKKKIKRIVFNEITESAVKQALSNSRDLNMRLIDAQQARRVLDRLIGFKLSPVISKKIKKGLSAGRVQSVAVRLVCDREKEILGFTSTPYFLIDVEVEKEKNSKPFILRFFASGSPDNVVTITKQAEADKIVETLSSAKYSVLDIKKSQVSRRSAPPFITSTLQQEASRKLNWTTKRTMSVAQQLYEGIEIKGEHFGLITYMRTDSTRISDEAKLSAKDYIINRFGEKYLLKYEKVTKKSANVQDAHEAIRPSQISFSPDTLKSQLSTDHFKLYQLIWNRFIASQMSDCISDRTQVIVKANEDLFLRATGSVVIFDGFTTIYTEDVDEKTDTDETQSKFPALTISESLLKRDVLCEEKFTQPPSRYTEASLVKALEELGVGRPSTYAPTLSTVQDRGYVEKQGKSLHPTELGMLVNDQLTKHFETVVDTHFTAQMETELDEIMEGKHKWQEVIDLFYQPFSKTIDHAYKTMEKISMDKPTDEVCEKCNHPMVIKMGRFGEFKSCSNFPECKNTKAIVNELEVNCPECQSALVEKKTKKGKLFYACSGFPKCKFASWDEPVKETCPTCSASIMFKKKSVNKGLYCQSCSKTS